MRFDKSFLASQGAISGFVLLWGSAAIFTRLGLDNASPLALIACRFIVALIVLLTLGIIRGRLLPPPIARKKVLLSGVMIIGGYSLCYFEAMAHGVTPGLIATIMGIQPLLTLCLVKPEMNGRRVVGLIIALSGLILLVWRSLAAAQMSGQGLMFALAALLFMTFGAILQQKLPYSPAEVLPVQYAVSLLLCLFLVPFSSFRINFNREFVMAVLFLGVFISVVAQLLLYRLLNAGNIVNVTSLFYLVPVITAILDYVLLGNRLPLSGIIGMAAIIGGVSLVFRKP
ncbi:DMT family transporter [Erwinia sp. 9145]|uniref:DMT family transporter n=1 Tax=Erwinia sp. 9145 TaxID=1500895 RepID=UPI0005551FA3|nr:DMT family transporter [Erwinia sp. 9145]